MQTDTIVAVDPAPYDGTERRSKPRLTVPFPVVLRGIDASGERFDADAAVDNLSASGFYVRIGREVRPGSTLRGLIRLSTAADAITQAARVTVRGVVLRSEPQADGSSGLAVALTKHRFL
jgi:hypothetical protein